MKALCLSLLLLTTIAAAPSASYSQSQSKPEQQTKLELFQAKTGSVVIKNFSEIGNLRGLGGTLTVQAWELIDAQTSKKEYGITIEVKESGRLEQEGRAFVDYDEIGSLLKGMDYVSSIDPTIKHLKHFQADYRTVGELRISVFNDSDGKIMAGVTVGRIGSVSAYYDMEAFAALRKLITDAKATLDAIK